MTKEVDNKSKSSTVIVIQETVKNEMKTCCNSPRKRSRNQNSQQIQLEKLLYYLKQEFQPLFITLIFGLISILTHHLIEHFQVIDPCDDFYKFACRSSSFSSQYYETHGFLSSIQKNMSENFDAQNIAEEKAQNFFKSCLKAASNPDSIVLNKELGEMLDKLKKIPHENHLQEKLELLHNEFGLSPFFNWAIFRDQDLNINVITIYNRDVNNFGADPKETGYFTKQVKASNEIKIMMDKMLGNRLNFTPQFDDFDELIELDKEMEKIDQPPLVNASDGQYHLMNLTQLENLTSFINWKDFLNNGLSLDKSLNLTIDDNEKIVVWCPQFLSNLSRKIEHLQKTRVDSGKLLDKFLIWQAGKEIFGQSILAAKRGSAVKNCSSLAVQYFKFAALSMHRRHVITKYPDLEDRFEMVQEMVVNIRQELVLVLEEAEWLNETSREDAVQKAEKTGVLIGYPDIVKDPKLLEQYYDFCPQMNESDFGGNMINHLKFSRLENSKSLRDPTDKNGTDIWSFNRIIAQNAFALPDYNLVLFPVTNLLPPLFSPDLPLSVNYGKVGVYIGHELAHCYRKFGSYSDNNQSTCFTDQYSDFVYPNQKNLDGAHTFNENFADNAGFEIVTRALYRLLDKTSSTLKKYENNETHVDLQEYIHGNEKLFFTSSAEAWCYNIDLLKWSQLYSAYPHSPFQFRVFGTVQNSASFSKTFNCSSNSPMNPEQKCSIF